MSILLSDGQILAQWTSMTGISSTEYGICKAVAKAAAIHVVQYLEGKCDDGKHAMSCGDGEYVWARHRYNCPNCMKQIHEEIEQ